MHGARRAHDTGVAVCGMFFSAKDTEKMGKILHRLGVGTINYVLVPWYPDCGAEFFSKIEWMNGNETCINSQTCCHWFRIGFSLPPGVDYDHMWPEVLQNCCWQMVITPYAATPSWERQHYNPCRRIDFLKVKKMSPNWRRWRKIH